MAALAREVERVRAEGAARRATMEEDKAKALERLRLELTGSAAEMAALKEADEKAARVELLRRQIGRRMLHQGLLRGFDTWVDTWQRRQAAFERLRSCGNQLRTPALAACFRFWTTDLERAKQHARWLALEEQSHSLESQLRQAVNTMGDGPQMDVSGSVHPDDDDGIPWRWDDDGTQWRRLVLL